MRQEQINNDESTTDTSNNGFFAVIRTRLIQARNFLGRLFDSSSEEYTQVPYEVNSSSGQMLRDFNFDVNIPIHCNTELFNQYQAIEPTNESMSEKIAKIAKNIHLPGLNYKVELQTNQVSEIEPDNNNFNRF